MAAGGDRSLLGSALGCSSTGGGGAGRTTSAAGSILANLTAECGSITYEADCFAAVESAATAASSNEA